MKSYRVRTGKKDELEADKFLGLTDKVMLYVQENQTRAYTALGVIGVVIILTILVSMLMEQSKRNLLAQESEAIKYYDVNSPVPGDKPMEPAERYQKAVEMFSDIAGKHSGSPYAGVSEYYKASAEMALGDTAKAIEGYRALAGRSGSNPALYSIANLRLASALRANGDVQGALDIYKALTEKGVVKDQAHMMLGKMYEEAGDTQKAVFEYKLVKKDFPGSPWAPDANARVARLAPEEAAAPAAPPAPAMAPVQAAPAAKPAPAATPAAPAAK